MSLIELCAVTKDYQTAAGSVRALDGVSVRVEGGALCAVVGPSGSGKSTMLGLMGGLDRPTVGRVRVAGREISGLRARTLARFRLAHVGFVFQANNLVPVLTARENVALPLSLLTLSPLERRRRVDALLGELGLSEVAARRVAALSGGQQQRVGIARALVTGAPVVLADEPTAHLDADTGHEVMRLVRTLNEARGTTFIFSTHDRAIERLATQRIALRSGRRVATSDEGRESMWQSCCA